MKIRSSLCKVSFLVVAAFVAVFPVSANFHTWKVNEIYSNADGSVQFIEMKEGSGLNGQQFLPGHSIICITPSGTNRFNFPANLPSSATANKFFVIGTSNLVSMPGGLKPDYMFTNAGPFLSLTVGTVNFGIGNDIIAYTNPPTDGSGSMIRSGAVLVAVATNQPISFAPATNSLVPLRFTSIVQSGNDVVLSFPTAKGTNGTAGPNYALQSTNTLGGLAWTTLTNLTGNGSLQTVTVPIGPVPSEFFRLRVP